MIEKSEGWCCEVCGKMIKGKCSNIKGYVTHIKCKTNKIKKIKKHNCLNLKNRYCIDLPDRTMVYCKICNKYQGEFT